METFHRIPWPPEYMEMERIAEFLKCGICHDFIETTVMTPCSHNYCSLCIRKYLHYKTRCPACFQTIFEKDLHANRILDEIMIHFVKIRAKLADSISAIDKNATSAYDCYQPCPTFHVFGDADKSLENDSMLITTTADVSNTIYSSSKPCTSSSRSERTIDDNSHHCQMSDKQVPCPVCQVKISQVYINRHLDECIKRESVQKECLRVDKPRKLLPKLVFNLMKDSELKKKMKQMNLPTQGDRKTLENRFQRYCTLYNAESDKKNPRTVAALLEQCMDEELIEKKLAKSSLGINKLKVSRNAEQNDIDETNKKYMKMNARSYQNLIESIKNRAKYKESDDAVKLNDCCAMTSTHNIVQIRASHEPNLPLSDFVIFNHRNQNSSDPLCSDSSGKKSATKGNVINSQLYPKVQMEAITIANGNENLDNELLNIDNENSSINGLATYCAVEEKEPHTLESNDNEAEFIVTSIVQPTASCPIGMLQHNRGVNMHHTDYTDNFIETVKPDGCSIKRRLRLKCNASSEKSS